MLAATDPPDPTLPPMAGGAALHDGEGEIRRSTWYEAAAMVPDIGRLLRDLIADPRVPLGAKLMAGAGVVYAAVPVGPLPEVVRGTGIGVDDLVALVWVVRRLVVAAGYDVVREHWTGTDTGFVLLMLLTGIDE